VVYASWSTPEVGCPGDGQEFPSRPFWPAPPQAGSDRATTPAGNTVLSPWAREDLARLPVETARNIDAIPECRGRFLTEPSGVVVRTLEAISALAPRFRLFVPRTLHRTLDFFSCGPEDANSISGTRLPGKPPVTEGLPSTQSAGTALRSVDGVVARRIELCAGPDQGPPSLKECFRLYPPGTIRALRRFFTHHQGIRPLFEATRYFPLGVRHGNRRARHSQDSIEGRQEGMPGAW